ncbi:MAG: hypothetical protein CM15mL4_2920 [uncultured marine virus]|nr:MAG: hypothetical protein CM15mL4_2920 [uncultured marine virus]
MNVIYIVQLTPLHQFTSVVIILILYKAWEYYCEKNNIDLKVIDVNDENLVNQFGTNTLFQMETSMIR